MPMYPNDPGMDNQKPVEFNPTHEYEVLDIDSFIKGIELQTKYSYQCSTQMMDNAVCHSSNLFEEAAKRIDNLMSIVNENMNKIDDAFKGCHDAINENKKNIVELYRRTDIIREEMNVSITDHERQVILAQIYDLA